MSSTTTSICLTFFDLADSDGLSEGFRFNMLIKAFQSNRLILWECSARLQISLNGARSIIGTK